ncbi:MAG TPA: protein kinase [Kofleriaceae bacterium]|nr:protein kinase [Kofleriaceae bacterium]
MTDRPPPETVHVPDGPLEGKPGAVSATPPASGSGEHATGKGHLRLPMFGRFQTTAELGAGAMGTVYRAHDDVLGRDVAIKALTSDDGLGTRERFLREARAIGAVQHANILAIYDAGSEGATPYLVVELATGGTLRDRIKTATGPTPVSVETARSVGIQIARALAAAHAAGIIHRDVKPANILATRDAAGAEVWKLADFGIARTPDSTLTMTGQFIGSPSYAAPESLREGKFSATSDVYGLAATLYEALSGSPPHGDHDMRSVIRKLDHEAPALAEKRADVPGAIGTAIMAGLARDPEKRPTAEQLAKLLETTDDRVPPVPVAPRAPTSPNLKWLAFALVGVAVVLLAFALSRRDKASSPMGGLPIDTTPAANKTSEQPTPTESPSDEQTPQFVDQNGNPVDEETAKAILQQMQQDADEQLDHGPGKGHKKKKHRDQDWP